MSEVAIGYSELALEKALISLLFPALVSKIVFEGPPLPRASKLSTNPIFSAQGCSSTKRLAPLSPISSASVKQIMMLFLCGISSFRKTRIVSKIVATPEPASLAPNEECTALS